MANVDVSVKIYAPVERVWAIVSDHERMPEWGKPLKRVTLLKQGSPEKNGIGAVREMEVPGQQTITEEVIGWDPPRSYDYTIISGAPVRAHRGRIVLMPLPGGCEVRWSVELTPSIPFTGTAMAIALRLTFKRMLVELKKLCET